MNKPLAEEPMADYSPEKECYPEEENAKLGKKPREEKGSQPEG